MNRRRILSISAMTAFGLVLLPGSAAAQQKPLKEQLIGTWTLVSCESTSPNGAKQPYCVNPNGVLILDAGGRYAQVIAARSRPKLSGGNRAEVPAEQFKAAAMGMVANFGTWSANEADKTMTSHYEGALFPNVEGADFKYSVSLAGDELKLVGQVPILGGKTEAVWRRAK